MDKQLGIQIVVAIDGEEIAKRTSLSFDSAEEDLGKLRAWFEEEQAKQEELAKHYGE